MMRFSTGAIAAIVAALAGCAPAPQPGPSAVLISANGIEFDGLGAASQNRVDQGRTAGDLYTNCVVPGIEYGDDGFLKRDIALQSIALGRDPALASARIARAGAELATTQWDSAIADLSAVIQTRPSEQQAPGMLESAFLMRSEVYEKKRLYTLAIADDTQAISIDPANSVPWNGRCWHRAIIGELTSALADCDQALLLSPNSAMVLDSRAFVYLKMRDYGAAITGYQAALQRSPRQAGSLYGLGLAKQAAGEAGAEGDFATATKIDPKIASDFGT